MPVLNLSAQIKHNPIPKCRWNLYHLYIVKVPTVLSKFLCGHMPINLLRFRTKETEWKDRTTFAALLSIWFVNILHLHIGFQSVRLLSVSETPCFSCAHSEFTSLIAKQCQFPRGNHLAKNAPVTSRLSRRHFRWLQPLSPVGKSTCDKTQQFHTIPTHNLLRLAAKGQVARKK